MALTPGSGDCSGGLESHIKAGLLEHCPGLVIDGDGLKQLSHALACAIIAYLLENAEFQLAEQNDVPKWGDPGLWGDGGMWERNIDVLLTTVKLK